MQGITRKQVVESVRYQGERQKLDSRRYVVYGIKSGQPLTEPLPKITAEHCASTWNASARDRAFEVREAS